MLTQLIQFFFGGASVVVEVDTTILGSIAIRGIYEPSMSIRATYEPSMTIKALYEPSITIKGVIA